MRIARNNRIRKDLKSGFTLLEVLGLVIVVVMLLLIAGPILSNLLLDSRVQMNRDNAADARQAAMDLVLSRGEGNGYYEYVVSTKECTKLFSLPEGADFTTKETDLSKWQRSVGFDMNSLLGGNPGVSVYDTWVILLQDGMPEEYFGYEN